MRELVGCVLLATMSGWACDKRPLPTLPINLPDAQTCASTSWTVVYSFGSQPSSPAGLRFRDGTLYVAGQTKFVGHDQTGGQLHQLASEHGEDCGVETFAGCQVSAAELDVIDESSAIKLHVLIGPRQL